MKEVERVDSKHYKSRKGVEDKAEKNKIRNEPIDKTSIKVSISS